MATALRLPFSDALHLKNAEYWLELGKPDQALKELQQVTLRDWENPKAERLVWRAAKESESSTPKPE
jgi:predicted Zn-dependent protease